MALSFALIILLGSIAGRFFQKLKLPSLLGMLLIGILIGPYGLQLLQTDMLLISKDIRGIALIIILLRAGHGIKKDDFRIIGPAAIRMSCIPGILEGLTIALCSTVLLSFSFIQGGMLGFIIAAVSPAVVVPAMLKLMEEKRGTNKNIPTLIMASASIDDVFAITIFTAFLGLYQGTNNNIFLQLLHIPFSILIGILLGGLVAILLLQLFKRIKMSSAKQLLILLSSAILLNQLEHFLQGTLAIASLLGVMTIGFLFSEKSPEQARKFSSGLQEIWELAEVFLFVLVGAEVNIHVVLQSGIMGICLVFVGLIARSIGVLFSVSGTNLTLKEKLFCVISYLPKATVQAAMGAVPLSFGVIGGDLILAISVLSIVITAPLGAIGIHLFAPKLLQQEKEPLTHA